MKWLKLCVAFILVVGVTGLAWFARTREESTPSEFTSNEDPLADQVVDPNICYCPPIDRNTSFLARYFEGYHVSRKEFSTWGGAPEVLNHDDMLKSPSKFIAVVGSRKAPWLADGLTLHRKHLILKDNYNHPVTLTRTAYLDLAARGVRSLSREMIGGDWGLSMVKGRLVSVDRYDLSANGVGDQWFVTTEDETLNLTVSKIQYQLPQGEKPLVLTCADVWRQEKGQWQVVAEMALAK